MTERLDELISQLMTKDKAGKTKLAMAVKKHQGTIERWLRSGRIPGAHNRYLVALACGCTEKEALSLAKECLPKGAMKAG